METTTNIPDKQKYPSRIYVKNATNKAALCKMLTEIIGSKSFSYKSRGPDIIITATSLESHRAAIRYLVEEPFYYDSFYIRKDQPLRIVIRNLNPFTPKREIGIELEKKGFVVKNIRNVVNKSTNTLSPIFFVDLEPSYKNYELFNITNFLHTDVVIERPHAERFIIQCRKCQQYGHGQYYCNREPKCVHCAGSHFSYMCEKPHYTPAKCVLCGEGHRANYRGCVVHRNLKIMMEASLRSNFSAEGETTSSTQLKINTSGRSYSNVTAGTSQKKTQVQNK